MNESNAATRQVHSHPRPRLSPIVASIAIALLPPGMAYAADERSVAELEAEVVRLQQLLEQKRRVQNDFGTQAAPEVTIAAAATTRQQVRLTMANRSKVSSCWPIAK